VHDPDGFDKEARFFCRPGPYDTAAYRSLFERPPGLLTGEWTPDYLWDAEYTAGLHAAAPDAKILLLLRDPVERFVSGVAHLLMYDEPIHERALRKTYRAGLYGLQARRLLRRYRSEQVLVLQYERCIADPAGELARTYRFLGLDPFVPESLLRTAHETTVEKPVLPERFSARLVEGYRRDAVRLLDAFPQVDLSLWPSVRGERLELGRHVLIDSALEASVG
jgi:hypothetical protein